MKADGVIKKVDHDKAELDKYLSEVRDIDSYKDFPELKDNPFTCLLGDVVSMNWKTKGVSNSVASVEFTDTSTGEVVEASMNKIFRRKEYVDRDKFNKIYFSQMKEMFALSHTALKVFGYILNEMQKRIGSDSVFVILEDCMVFCDWDSRTMIYKGLTELILKGFICKTNIPWNFFINPLYAFNGDRIVVFSEYVKTDYFQKDAAIGDITSSLE